MNKNYNELQISDDFMFCKVMQNPKICKKLLETILNINISKIEYPETQKVLDLIAESKSVRLDVYVNDEHHTIYNIEMQTYKKDCLPKRMRYYQDITDLNILYKGEKYNALPKNYIIFICVYDPFNQNKAIYTFENKCVEEPELLFGDDTKKIVLYTNGIKDNVSPELSSLLTYFENYIPIDEFTNEIHKEVEKARNNEEWRREFMTLLMRDDEMRKQGIQNILVELFIENSLPLSKVLEKTNLSEEEFLDLVNEYQKEHTIN